MPGCWVGSRGSRGIRGSTAVSGRRDVRAPGACVVERSSERGMSGGAERQRRQGRGACSSGAVMARRSEAAVRQWRSSAGARVLCAARRGSSIELREGEEREEEREVRELT